MLFAPNADDGVEFLETSQEALRAKYGIEQFDFPYPDSGIRHIGYAPKDQTWYGWSHRAIYGFKVGSTVKAGDVIATSAEEPFASGDYEHFAPGFTAKTLHDARRMAAAFARAVS